MLPTQLPTPSGRSLSLALTWCRDRIGPRPLRRILSLFLVYLLLHSQGLGLMQSLRAETAGATAPEVTKFEPVDTTDLVNLATGDFNYTIPVINVPGPEGGYPLALSYHAGIVQGEEASWVGLGWNLQPGSISRGVRGYPDDFKGIDIVTDYKGNQYETFSLGFGNFSGWEVGISYTTYRGFGGYVQYGWGESGITARLSYQQGEGWGVGVTAISGGLEIGLNWNERSGVGLSANYKINKFVGIDANVDSHYSSVSITTSMGVTLSADSTGRKSATVSNGRVSASFAQYSGGGQQSESVGLVIPIFNTSFYVRAGYARNWIHKFENESAFGYYYHTEPDPGNSNVRVNEWTMESDPKAVPGDSKEHALASGLHYLPSNDGYAVMGQGTGGSLKLTRREDRVYKPRRLKDEWTEYSSWPWNGVPDNYTKARFVFDGDNTERLNNPSSVGLSTAVLQQFVDPLANDHPIAQGDMASTDTRLFLGKEFARGSRLVKEQIAGGLFNGFDIWEMDGKRYTYGEPVWNWNSESIAANRNTIGSGEWFRSKTNINQKYAYAWYLTELRYPDYADSDAVAGLSEGDRGGWVKFSYLLGSPDYRWHSSPDGQFNDGPLNRIDKLGKEKAGMMYNMQSGTKQLKYLKTIETATHAAYFVSSPRVDSLEKANGGQIRNVTFNITPIGSEFEFEVGDLKDIGLILPPDAVRQVITDPLLNEYCPPRSVTSEGLPHPIGLTTTKITSGSRPLELTLNGIPLTASVVFEDFTTGGECVLVDPDLSAYRWDPTYSFNYRIRVNPSDQFWNKSIPGSPNAFQDLQSRWTALTSGPTWNQGVYSMMKLDDIYLIEKSTNQLIKQVHFKYSYRLAPGAPSTVSMATNTTPENQAFQVTRSGGRLTLEAVEFFGRGGKADPEAKLPPYKFKYDNNPDWGSKYAYDRWGFHKSDGGQWRHRDVIGTDQSAWCLTKITLPTGGTLQIQYEPKDYTRVQDRLPMNPRANQGTVSQYMVDLRPWVGDPGVPNSKPWPLTDAEWTDFKAKLQTTPFTVFSPNGTTLPDGTVIRPATSELPEGSAIPIQSAPNPRDLKLWLLSKSDSAYSQLRSTIPAALGSTAGDSSVTLAGPGGSTTVSVPDTRLPLTPQQAALSQPDVVVERMVNLMFEYWTAGARAQKRLKRPWKLQDADGVGQETEDDRGDCQVKAALVRMKQNADGSMSFFVTDPDFEWPRQAPSSMYITWTANPSTPKLGGGPRVKRIVSFDGSRSYTTAYLYTDYINGEWTSSGVAAQEPPPFGYSSDDDRVIQTEKGGWANEGGGGIIHSRVVVRHSWTEDPTPAGVNNVTTPMGESVYRFITPADLPHRQQDVDYARTLWQDTNGTYHNLKTTALPADTSQVQGIYTNSMHVTEIMNVGAWWGKLLWKEDRDRNGRPLNRVENVYTQLDGYLRMFQVTNDGRPVGFDPDVEKAWNVRDTDMSYVWAAGGAPSNLPTLVAKENQLATTVGVELPTGSPGYLNTSANITVLAATTTNRSFLKSKAYFYWKTQNNGEVDDPLDPEAGLKTGWHSSVKAVRELNLPPLVQEVRTYGEGLRLLGVVRNTKWDARTGTVLETQTRGRKLPSGNDYEWLINRTWPASWVYAGMDTAPAPNAPGFPPLNTITNMLRQTAQTTSLRQSGSSQVFLNSKVDTWWQPLVGSAWMKGGAFVWNGRGGNLQPEPFPGFSTWSPATITAGNLQQFTSNNWLFAGATTRYDAYAHPLEAVDGDGVYGCSKYGYPYSNDGAFNLSSSVNLPAGTLPVAKFTNARDEETLYLNFEGPSTATNALGVPAGTSVSTDPNPLQRLNNAYTGERACQGGLSVTVPSPVGSPVTEYELRYFVKAGSAAAAQASYPAAGEILQVVPAEACPDGNRWWLVRAKVVPGASRSLSGMLIDDVSAFPWRRNGAPASVSHYAYDRALGLVTSITGSNGRTTRYQYDKLGRLMKTYDVYGKAASSTRYVHVAQ